MNDKRFTGVVAGVATWAAWFMAFHALADDAGLKITQTPSAVTITRDGKPVLVYQSTPLPQKCYVKELFSPAGVQILRDSPADHKHHHALMYAIGADGVDFWSEGPANGTQKPAKLGDAKSEGGKAGFVQDLNWVGPAGKTILVERRAIEVAPSADGKPGTFVNWNTRFTLPQGADSAKLYGSHYFGLGMRFIVSMDQGGRFFNSAEKPGEPVRGSESLVAARWCAYTAKADGKPVTVAVFDHPKNPRHPNKFFTMSPFAYISATLNLWKEPMVLKAGEKLDLRYGVALWDGEVTAEQVEALYGKWRELQIAN
jgi:hypothetical protein